MPMADVNILALPKRLLSLWTTPLGSEVVPEV